MARWLAARGFTAFVLFYRLPGEGWASGPDTPLADAQRAMRLIRHRARDFAIDPERVAAMGFSAGGHVCADLAARFAAPVYAPVDAADRLSAKPHCAAPHLSGGQSWTRPSPMPDRAGCCSARTRPPRWKPPIRPTATCPPMPRPHFLLHAEDDDVRAGREHLAAARGAARRARNPGRTAPVCTWRPRLRPAQGHGQAGRGLARAVARLGADRRGWADGARSPRRAQAAGLGALGLSAAPLRADIRAYRRRAALAARPRQPADRRSWQRHVPQPADRGRPPRSGDPQGRRGLLPDLLQLRSLSRPRPSGTAAIWSTGSRASLR